MTAYWQEMDAKETNATCSAKHIGQIKRRQVCLVKRLLMDMAAGLWSVMMHGGKDRNNYTDIPHPHLVLLVLSGIWKAGDDSSHPGG